MRSYIIILSAIFVSLLIPNVAWAGMPSITLSDITRLRVQTISFFLCFLLGSAWGIQRIWNGFSIDFPKLSKLKYRTAVGVVIVWGLVFILVLTMISGARELMTPGAWKKNGATYQLAESDKDNQPSEAQTALLQARREKFQNLQIALLHFAATHNGQFPDQKEQDSIPLDMWQLPERMGTRYRYEPGHHANDRQSVLALEPEVYGDRQLVLMTDGEIRSMSPSELQTFLSQDNSP